MRYLWLLSLLAFAAALIAAQFQSGGTACLCLSDFQPWGCTSLVMEYVEFDGTNKSSRLSSVSTVVPSGTLMPRLVLQVASNATGETARAVDSSVTVSFKLASASAGVSIDASSAGVRTFQDGIVVYENIMMHGATGLTFQLNFTTSLGLWIATPSYSLFVAPALPTIVNDQYSVQFAPDGTSYFSSPSLSGVPNIVLGITLPRVVIQVVDQVGRFLTYQDGLATAVATYTSNVNANLTLSGTTATLSGAIATFDSLVVENSTLPGVPFTFQFIVHGVGVQTRAISATVLPVPNSGLTFATARESYITPSSTSAHAAINVPMPTIRIRVINTGNQYDTGDYLFIRASCNTSVLDPWGSVAVVRRGIAVFDNLTFVSRRGSDTRSAIIGFEADTNGNQPVSGTMIYSPGVFVWLPSQVSAAVYLRFRIFGSFFVYEGQPRFVVSGSTLPTIAIEGVRADGVRAVASSGIAVQVQCSVGQALTGSNLLPLDSGVALFTDLVLTSTDTDLSVTLQFSASGLNTVVTGTIVIRRQVQHAASMRFEPSYMNLFASEQDGSAFMVASTSGRNVIIQILDGGGSVDDDSPPVVVTAVCTALCSPTTGVSINGRVIFKDFMFALPGLESVRFVAAAPGWPVDGTWLQSMPVTVEASVVDQYALQFDPTGFIQYSGQNPTICLGTALPSIGVYLVDSTASPSSTSVPNNMAVATINRGAFLGGATQFVVPFDSTLRAWFNLTLDSTATTLDPVLCFSVLKTNQSSPLAADRSLCTGVMAIASSCAKAIGLVVVPPTNMQDFSNSSQVLDILGGMPTQTILYNESIVFAMGVAAIAAGPRQVGATTESDSILTIKSDAGLIYNSTSTIHLPVVGATSATSVTLPPFRFSNASDTTGFFSTLRITSAQSALQNFELVVGPFERSTYESLAAYDVVVALVSVYPVSFSWERWKALLAEVMNIDPYRVQLVRWRESGQIQKDTTFTWRGVRIEFRFLSPTPSSVSQTSAEVLRTTFLNLADQCNGLNVYQTFEKTQEAYCDVFRLSEQATASRRCISVSSADLRCNCYHPMFLTLGKQCIDTTELKLLCSQLSTCPSSNFPAISKYCSSYKNQVYLQYLEIFGAASGATLLVLLAYAYTSGVFERRKRAKVNDDLSQHLTKPLVATPGFADLL